MRKRRWRSSRPPIVGYNRSSMSTPREALQAQLAARKLSSDEELRV